MQDKPITVAETLAMIEVEWQVLLAFVSSLSEAQMTGPTDAAGWTVKDHLLHLAVWERGMLALLNGQPFNTGLGVDAGQWAERDFDAINAVIQGRTRDVALAAALEQVNDGHTRLVARIAMLADADLARPHSSFDPTTTDATPVYNWIEADTFGHYEEHLPWMEAIARSGAR